MKKIILALAAAGALVMPAVAQADVTHQFPSGIGAMFGSWNCSATAYTPVISGTAFNVEGGMSCGGAQYNLYKSFNVCLQFLGANGVTWFNAQGGCAYFPRTRWNPYRGGISPGYYAGRKYRTEVSNATVDNGAGSGSTIGPVDSQWVQT